MGSNRGRTGPRWEAAKAATFARSTTCARCGQPIDMGRSGMDPMGPMLGHIIDLEDGGALYALDNLQPEHRRCGIVAGNEARIRRRDGDGGTSREW